MNEFSLSVVIPNFNNSKFISMCIDSILNQSRVPDEIIVVDDCSTDDSAEIIKSYEEKYSIVKGIYLKKNGGVSNARNTGIRQAKCQYISFIDSDDYYYSRYKLENEMNLIKQYAIQSKDVLAYSATVSVDYGGKELFKTDLDNKLFINGNAIYNLVAGTKYNNIPRDYCIKKDILIEVGAYSFYKNFYEDLDLLMRLSRVVPFCFTGGCGTAYRNSENGLSKRTKEEHFNTVKEIRDCYYKKLSYLDKLIAKSNNYYYRVKSKLHIYKMKIMNNK